MHALVAGMKVRLWVVAAVGLLVVLQCIAAQASSSNVLRGAVVNADGTMVDRFTVVVRPFADKPILIQRKHFSKGIFMIERLDRQKYDIVVSAPKYIPVHLNVVFPKNGSSTQLKVVILHPVLNDKDADRRSAANIPEVATYSYNQGL